MTLPIQDPPSPPRAWAEPLPPQRVPAQRAAGAQGRGGRAGDHRVLRPAGGHRPLHRALQRDRADLRRCTRRRRRSHWLGCDDGGIDMLSELMQGGRISLVVGFAATLVAIVIGGGVGHPVRLLRRLAPTSS